MRPLLHAALAAALTLFLAGCYSYREVPVSQPPQSVVVTPPPAPPPPGSVVVTPQP